VRIVDAAGVDRTEALPELAGLAVRVAARSAILDGELVVVDGAGRADSAELARRLAGTAGRSVAFLAFDLLVLDGRSLLSQPLDRRREALRRVLRPGDEVLAVPAIAAEGIALFEAAVAQGIAGVLARQRSSPYLPGVRSRLWRYVAARPGAGGPGPAAGAGEGTGGAADEVPGAGVVAGGAGPVLALISRLPLDEG
jgi:ATP-dependent DNA ligase